MLETERHDREPDNDGPTGAGDSAGVTGSPAEAGEDASPQAKETGGAGRRLFRRGRRAVTRPAGPPADDLGHGEPASSETTIAGSASVSVGADATAGGASSGGPGTARPASDRKAEAAPASAAGPSGLRAPGFAAAPPAPAFTAASPAPAFTAAPPAEPETQGPHGSRETPPAQVPWQSREPRPSSGSRSSQQAQAGQEPPSAAFQPPLVIFQPPDISSGGRPAHETEPDPAGETWAADAGDQDDETASAAGGTPKRRRRGGRGHAKAHGDEGEQAAEQAADGGAAGGNESAGRAPADAEAAASRNGGDGEDADDASASGGRRRRRRRRSGPGGDADSPASDDPPNTVVHVRAPRASAADDVADVRGVKGSTRLEAKRQRRREGRESGRRRPPIITESEFLARREAVERVMVVRQHGDRTQIAVLEDGVLVEHYVDKASHQSYVGNVYLGRVQNVLPSMEAAFVDIGKGRNAVLYAGEVNFDASGLEGESKRIESALKSGQSILVQATKDPIGHKGARLTSQVSLPGRYLVYVPGANMTGISRKLPDTERTRLKQILKQVMPENAGVIVRTAAEGATEEELSHDVARLAAQWEAIERKAKSATAPELLYSEPDLTIRVVRDIFNEDFTKLVIASDGDWDMVDEYVRYVAPNLAERLERWTSDQDVFGAYRIDEQIAKALERKVWLPSGGSLVIDTTEAMTVIDVNTGKFTGQGGNLEQTVTRNNLEAAEEIVRQLRVRDVGGIIVIDFIDMVLESNRDLVLRRLLECLARDRTKHQVAEVTSLGLVQMTRKRVGSGLLEAFSVPCECCNGRGVIISLEPVDHVSPSEHHHGRNGSARGGSARSGGSRDSGRGGASREGGRGSSGSGAAGSSGDAGAAGLPDGSEANGTQGEDGQDGHASGGGAASDGDAPSSRRGSGGRRRRRAAEARQDQAAATDGEAADSAHRPAESSARGDAAGDVPMPLDTAGQDATQQPQAATG
jgi:ribonuclease E